MKYSKIFSLEIKMEEFLQYAKPLVDNESMISAINNELYHCWHGIVDGEWGGDALEWKKVFYIHLFKDGFIEQTEESIQWYGKFEK